MEIEHLYRLFSEHQTVTTDSRDCPEGSIFFALKGESFDGNRFAETALQKGCSYATRDTSSRTTRSTLSSSWHATTAGSSTYP